MPFKVAMLCSAASLAASVLAPGTSAKNLKVAVVQTTIESRLEDNLAKVLRFIDQARKEQCRLVVLPEHTLLPFEAPDKPTKAELDVAFDAIRRRAESARLCVVLSDGYRRAEGGVYETHGIVYTEDGTRAVLYRNEHGRWASRDPRHAENRCREQYGPSPILEKPKPTAGRTTRTVRLDQQQRGADRR